MYQIAAQNLAQAFEGRARALRDRACLKRKYDGQWQDISWHAVSDASARLRAGFYRMGIKPGDRIAIMADNCPEWIITDLAANGMGAAVVPVYTTSSPDDTRWVLTDSGARIAVVRGDAALKKILALSRDLPELETVIAIDGDAATRSRSNGAPAVITMESAGDARGAPVIEGSRADLATIIYTSGTTGPPKGVMLTHGNILANCEGSLEALQANESDSTLSFLPIAHAFERTVSYTLMFAGATIAYAESLGQIAQNLKEIQPTIQMAVPRVLELIYTRVMRTVEGEAAIRRAIFRAAVVIGKRAAAFRHRGQPVPLYLAEPMALFRKLVFARIREIFGGRLKYLISGSAPLPIRIFDLLAAAEVPIVEGYGLTEAAPVVSTNLHGRTRIGTVGQPLKNVEASTAPDGELLLRGPSIMKGYYKRDEETREAIDPGGWLHTGDIARIDAEGYITITDRKKEIIVLSGGKNVSPANLEAKLTTDSCIEQACVIGDRKKHLAALIVPNFETLGQQLGGLTGKVPAQLVQNAAVRAFFQGRIHEFNKRLSDVEAISAFTLLAEPFSQERSELTPTMKVRRRVVQEHYREQIQSMYPD